MTTTDELIDQLAQGGGQSNGKTRLKFALPLMSTALASVLALLILLGPPFLAVAQLGIMPMAAKWGFSFLITGGALLALYALAHPGRRSTLLLFVALLPLGVMILLALPEFSDGFGDIAGTSWRTCLLALGLLGMLGFAAAIYATRQLAPVRLRHAGLAAGLFGGGLAASAYAPFCPEVGAVYLIVCYGGPILLLGAFGWLVGPRLLRW